MARGNQGRGIFRDDQDRKEFLDTLSEACQKTGWQIHVFVLMGNHRVAQAVSRMRRRPARKLQGLQRKLAKALNDPP